MRGKLLVLASVLSLAGAPALEAAGKHKGSHGRRSGRGHGLFSSGHRHHSGHGLFSIGFGHHSRRHGHGMSLGLGLSHLFSIHDHHLGLVYGSAYRRYRPYSVSLGFAPYGYGASPYIEYEEDADAGAPGPEPERGVYEEPYATDERDDVAPRDTPPEASAETATGTIQLSVTPNDASVYLDGQYIGQAEELRPISLPAGRHRVEVVRPGYAGLSRMVEVPANRTTDLELELRSAR